jgi:uncharacterized membrane protein
MVSLDESFSVIRKIFLQRFPWRVILIVVVVALVLVWMLSAPDGVLGKADAIGYAVCHRLDHRSFHIGNYQFSVCARCTGQYLGAVLGLSFLSILHPRRTGRPSWFVIGILLIGVAGYAIDGSNSFLHLLPFTERFWIYEPNNSLRLFTGTMMGLGISVMLFPAFNQTIWQKYDYRPVLAGWRDFGGLLALAGLLDLLVLTENSVILYPLSLVSAAGVLLLLTLVYSMVWIMIFRVENKVEKASQLLYPLLAGFAVALIQILVLDALRYGLTGTWGGFPLG